MKALLKLLSLALLLPLGFTVPLAHATVDDATLSADLGSAVEEAAAKVRPALVRIHVVETYYNEGREQKFEASGSGVVISPEGHIITNHHVAGHAKQLKCTFADKSELEAELVGSDPLTDIAIIKVRGEAGQRFQVIAFGDSDTLQVGDHVLAMGSPLALSQSVTLGIVSNTEMIMPDRYRRRGGLQQDGEDVGGLVRWIGHDAAIYPGNSGGPLVNMRGDIVGINEIGMGLGGAIPGNLAKQVAAELMATGSVSRAWLGIEVQPRLRHGQADAGVLVSTALKGSPAETAGIQPGDILKSLAGTPVDVQFAEQLPDFNRLVAELKIDEEVGLEIERDGQSQALRITPIKREAVEPKEHELREWGITVRNLSFMLAKEMKRDSTDGVLVTSVSAGGPAGGAKPVINENDVIVAVGSQPVRNVEDLRRVSDELTADAEEPLPVLTEFERKTAQYVTVVKVGLRELEDPGLEVKKAWLPVEAQVITREVASLIGDTDLTGFRLTHVYRGSTAEKAGLQVGDLLYAVDEEPLTAARPENYEELTARIRQYRAGDTVTLNLRRAAEELAVPVELVRAPKLDREMKKYRNDDFEFTVRDITFFDKATELWEEAQKGVLVDQVKSGSWAALGELSSGDLIQTVDGQEITDVDAMSAAMDRVRESKASVAVFKILRGIHVMFIELEPKWESQ